MAVMPQKKQINWSAAAVLLSVVVLALGGHRSVTANSLQLKALEKEIGAVNREREKDHKELKEDLREMRRTLDSILKAVK